jgi:glycosyltransferase involved in cell wall biosynthesis
MSRPRISLVTPSLNQAPFLERTIASVLSQEGDFDLDYLVLDGGSTDGSAEILRRAGAASGGRLRYRIEPDTGQSNAINKGLREARGDVVGWLNSDDLLYPGALARVARVFAERPSVVWVHGRCEIVDEEDRPIRRWVSAYKDWRCRHYSRRSLLVENYVSQMTVFWRREAHERVGWLDESMRFSFDYEFWLRLADLGDPVYLPERIAAFRWYVRSKSGAHFGRQFREDHDAFLRHAPPDPLLRAHKRLRTAQIVLAYRMLRAARAVGGVLRREG